jgi:hypothetical protein
MLGEQLEPQLPQLAALQRDGVVSAAKVQMVERAITVVLHHHVHVAATG